MKLRRRIAAQDFTIDMMPKTRRAVFVDVLKLHWFTVFIKMGVILFLAYLPVLGLSFMQDVYESKAIVDLAEDASAEKIQKLLTEIVSLRSSNAILSIVFLSLFGVVFSGVLRVIRQFAWEEVVFFWRDLWVGIKQNKGQVVGIFIAVAVQNLVSVYLTGTGQVTANQTISIVGTIFAGTSTLLFAPVWAFMCVQVSVYSNNFWQNLKLGFAVYAKTIPKTLLTLTVLAMPWFVCLVPNLWCHVIGQVLGVFLLPSALLIWFLYVFHLLDQHINPVYFPELVGKGLYKEEYTSEEDSSDAEIQNYKKEDLCD